VRRPRRRRDDEGCVAEAELRGGGWRGGAGRADRERKGVAGRDTGEAWYEDIIRVFLVV